MKNFTLTAFLVTAIITGATIGYAQIVNTSSIADKQLNMPDATSDNVMQILDAFYGFGTPIDIELVIYNNQEFVAFQLDVPLPEEIGYVAGSVMLNPERIVDHFIQANVLPGTNVLRMISFSLTNAAYLGNEGVMATFTVTHPDWPVDWLLPIENGIMATIEGVNILDYTIPGTITYPPIYFSVTFDVQDVDGEPIDNATVTLGDITNEPGDYVFTNMPPGMYFYLIIAEGYQTAEGEVEIIDEDLFLNVIMSEYTFYTILATSGDNGTISPSGMIMIQHGLDLLFTISPNQGYHIDDVLVDGGSVGPVAQYEFVNVNSDHTIHAGFAINVYNITAEPNNPDWGNIAGGGLYDHGQTVTLTAMANPNYEFIEWLEDGVAVSTDSIYVFTALADRNLLAIFDFVDGITENGRPDLTIRMYPNPASDIVQIRLNYDTDHIERIKLLDMCGKEVLSLDYPARADVYSVNTSSLLPGIYLVRIISADGIVNRRLIVM